MRLQRGMRGYCGEGRMTEDDILTAITVEQLLVTLAVPDQVMLLMVYRISCPADYTGPWPPTYTAIGHYIGMRYKGKPLREAAIRYRRNVALRTLASGRLASRSPSKRRKIEEDT